jgi:hypothetical protein
VSTNLLDCPKCGLNNPHTRDVGSYENTYNDLTVCCGLGRGTLCLERHQWQELADKFGVDRQLFADAAFDLAEYVVVAQSLLMFSDQHAKECRKNVRVRDRALKKKVA